MLALLILTACLTLITFLLYRRKQNYPPGPWPLPFIGSMHITRDVPHLACHEFAKKYGPILGITFASERTVVLHDTKLIRDTFNNPCISGRNGIETNAFIFGDEYGILEASGSIWTEQRRFAMKTLKEFGFGRASMEEMILEEARELCDWLKRQNGVPVELSRRFSLAIVNSLWRILTGERYDHDDKALLDMLDKLEQAQKMLLEFSSPLKVILLFFYPKLAKFLSAYTGWKKLIAVAKSRMDMFDRIIEEHSETLQDDYPRDFVDVYLRQVNRTQDKQSCFHPTTGKHALRSVMSDFFVAGTDTTAVTLNWTVLYLLHYPRVQERMRTELDLILGTERDVTLADRKNLHYSECVIMEVLRCSSIVAMGVGRMCTEDTKIGGYDIPKGTMVNANIYHVHHDPKVWGDPEVFRPERFLNPDGACMQRHESFMPFSVGRRVCMGENLGRDSLFLFATMLVQKFTLSLPEGAEPLTFEPRTGQITLQPKRFKVCMKARD